MKTKNLIKPTKIPASIKPHNKFFSEISETLEKLYKANRKITADYDTMRKENNRQKAEISRLKAENTAWYQVVALLEKYVESERIKGIETFNKAFRAEADSSVSTLTNSKIYSITETKLLELEREMTERHFKK